MQKQRFEHGCYQITDTQQQIAFWTHVIDTFACVIEHTDNVYTNGILKPEESYAYMGAVRTGFRKAIMNLPDDVKTPVFIYLEKRLTRCREIVPEDVMDVDFIFGYEH